tara:strand:+ start:392 stop:607 length:216 start_codon:yes stop_codon:yes gene_type:complete
MLGYAHGMDWVAVEHYHGIATTPTLYPTVKIRHMIPLSVLSEHYVMLFALEAIATSQTALFSVGLLRARVA